MNIDALVSAPVGYTVHVAGADWVKSESGIWMRTGEEWAGPQDGYSAASLEWMDRCYDAGERWFILSEHHDQIAGPLDKMPTLDECALTGGLPGRRTLGNGVVNSAWLVP